MGGETATIMTGRTNGPRPRNRFHHDNQASFVYHPTVGRETDMRRAKKRGRRGAGVVGVRSPLVIGGVNPGSTRRPPGSSRTSAGRLGRALSAAGKTSAQRAKPKASAAKALQRWENEGGRAERTPKPVAVRTPVPKQVASRSKSAPELSPLSTPLPLDRFRQRKTEARAKGSQIKRAGLESRLLGHVSGSGRCNRARRDSKNG